MLISDLSSDGCSSDRAGRGGGVAPQGVAGLACQLGSYHLPSAVIAPSIEISLHGRAWRKVLRQQTPLAAGGENVEDCVHHSTQSGPPRPAKPARRRYQRRYHRPFRVRRIACVAQALAPTLRTGDFSPGHVTRSEEHTPELQSLMRISY